ncbi:histidine phosphatase family protein [Alicyclobacillus tolerans]|uniref:histidine phosphatase family protein n=1 Tax=Alicyclobacillus tolerans TaxID=90970 RepID=UPI003556EE31|nr:histidine phosphatase family protein [Alicyclobacillus tolerans]
MGQTDTPLHPLGYEQTTYVPMCLMSEPISDVVSSPPQRAFATGITIAKVQESSTLLQDSAHNSRPEVKNQGTPPHKWKEQYIATYHPLLERFPVLG